MSRDSFSTVEQRAYSPRFRVPIEREKTTARPSLLDWFLLYTTAVEAAMKAYSKLDHRVGTNIAPE
jgi:hypothetical protein